MKGIPRGAVICKREDGTIRAEIMMLAGFCLLLFFSMGIYTLVKLPPELCFMYTVILNAEIMQICGYAVSVRTGCYLFSVLSAAGLVLFLLRGKARKSFFSPGIVFLFLLFAGAVVLFRGGFIQQYDDFHQWALEVKYMLENDVIPRAGSLVPVVPMESGLFNVFFQILGGYNEGNMHASSFLFTAAALMLPMAGIEWKKWYKGIVCLFLTYVGMFSIYKLPYKSLYVDLPAAAWSAVLCVWWITGGRNPVRVFAQENVPVPGQSQVPEKSCHASSSGQGSMPEHRSEPLSSGLRSSGLAFRLITVIPILLFITRIKWGIGLLLALFTAGFIALSVCQDRMQGSWQDFLRRRWKMILAAVAALLAVFSILWGILGSSFVPASLSGLAEALTVSSEKARLTLNTLIHNLFMKSLVSNPNMKLMTVQSVVILTVLLALTAYLGRAVYQKKICLFAVCYPFIVVAYTVALYVTYVSTFSYEESIRNATGYRYLSIIVLYGFFVLTGMMLHAFGREEMKNALIDGADGPAFEQGALQGIVAGADTDHTVLSGTAAGISADPAASERAREGFGRYRMQIVLVAGLCLFALSNVNSKIIYLASELRYWKLPQYEVIKETKDSISKIEEIIGEEDRVYLLSNEYNLENMNEYPLCVALYYLGDRVSNYLITPWEFNKEGSLSFVAKTDLTVDALPDLLRGGGYTYIWIHSYDTYLANEFYRLFDCRNLKEGLYRILYQEDGTIRLEFVSNLKE